MLSSRHIFITILCSVFSAVVALWVNRQLEPAPSVIIKDSAEAMYASSNDWLNDIRPRTFLSSSPTSFSSAAETVLPSVVYIKAYGSSGHIFKSADKSEGATGSGVIISKDGFIVTNNHVVEGASFFEVILNDKRQFDAELVGTDPTTDLALLRIRASNLPAAELGNSDSLKVGEWVLAVGNPFNLNSTVTAGIVSAKARSIDILEGRDRIEAFIQTDAVVNPGNSGGALVNTNGELVGINTAIITQTGSFEGYSFAVPVNLVRKIIRDLRDFGTVQRGLLGAYIEDVSAELADELQLKEIAGVHITRISENGGADNAGLQRGDVITKIDGSRVSSVPELQEIVGRYRPGDRVQIEYIRKGAKQRTEITLKNKNNNTSSLSSSDEKLMRELGFELRDLRPEEAKLLETDGVKVISIFRGSVLGEANMEPGFIITAINDKPINSMNQLLRRLHSARGEVVLKGVYENYEGEYFYTFRME